METKSPMTARAVVEPTEVSAPVESVVRVFAGASEPAILESSRHIDTYGRFSIFASDPVETISLGVGASPDPLSALFEHLNRYPVLVGPAGQIPFVGGWIGFLSYEAGLKAQRVEPHPPKGIGPPLARFGLYDAAVVFDHRDEQWYLTAVDWRAASAVRRPPVTERLAVLRERLQAASRVEMDVPPQPFTTRPIPNMSRHSYTAKVLRAKRYIEAGDVYQVNLTQRFAARTDASPLELYWRLREASPSSHAALLVWDDAAIVSSSPELFLDLRQGHVVTRPIKGTRPRTGDPRIDAIARRDLAASEKDGAELTMIVDLLRNDLGRVCSFGTVKVTEPGEIEEHPTVFHRVATIEGDLKPGMGWVDLLRAAFPGGSVTGAPKIRAMQIIRELEPTPRGVYCGSIGWIGLDGSMSLNLAIRTMVQRGDEVHLYAGGGIVAESTPEGEYEEVLAKLQGMRRALNCETPWETACPIREAVPTP
jgi:para-aminobenzoate synthetase component 1